MYFRRRLIPAVFAVINRFMEHGSYYAGRWKDKENRKRLENKEEYAARKDELMKQEAESRQELGLLEQKMAETVLVQNSLEETIGMSELKLSRDFQSRIQNRFHL